MLIPFKIERATPILSANRKKVEGHLEAASLHHIKAANELREGHYERAAQNALLAQKYLDLASENMRSEELENTDENE